MHTNDPSPGIPPRLLDRPTMGGLVVPYTTLQLPDGRWRFGAIDSDRQTKAFTENLCQTCGTDLDNRIVFAMRDMDLRELTSHEPGMHPECAAYSAAACPMLAGQMTHHQHTPLAEQLAKFDLSFHGDPTTESRLGKPASPWSLAWTSGYHLLTHPLTRQLAALILPEQLLKVRLITPGTEGAGS
ncbi:hypothetical protein [Catellatospora citrea]|uniref:Uncharacterized protein n=1 Tax=Catellatospora citrea TaxID=53366 RepID=A0A8J3P301_9ACTN|nr:hypothetical protein [Catellatospora citrea]RKE07916.1 hypothetical protein C8E86_2755 [Catellatospora citrea]GIG02073.1 hypothetical protein Cci01nite_71660 [Catellatospora citrea]